MGGNEKNKEEIKFDPLGLLKNFKNDKASCCTFKLPTDIPEQYGKKPKLLAQYKRKAKALSQLLESYEKMRKKICSNEFYNSLTTALDNVNSASSETGNTSRKYVEELRMELHIWQTRTKPALKKAIEDLKKQVPLSPPKQISKKDKKDYETNSKELHAELTESENDLKNKNAELAYGQGIAKKSKELLKGVGVVTIKSLSNAIYNPNKKNGIVGVLKPVRDIFISHSDYMDGARIATLSPGQFSDAEIGIITNCLNMKHKGYDESLKTIEIAARPVKDSDLPNLDENAISLIQDLGKEFYEEIKTNVIQKIKEIKDGIGKIMIKPKKLYKIIKWAKDEGLTLAKKYRTKLKGLYMVCINQKEKQRKKAEMIINNLFKLHAANNFAPVSFAGYASEFSENTLFSGGGELVSSAFLGIVGGVCIATILITGIIWCFS